MKKALIIGVSGFVGGYLAQELVDKGLEVYGADIDEGDSNKDIKFSKIDLLNEESIISVLSRIRPEYIINLAAISSVRRSWDIPGVTFDINVTGVINLFESIRKVNLETRVLLIGSSEQYGRILQNENVNEEYPLNAINPYAISKMTQEKIAIMYKEVYGIDVIMVRAFNHIGPNQRLDFAIPDFASQIAEIEINDNQAIIYVGNLNAERDFTDVRDIVKGYRLLLEKGVNGEVYNLGSGISYSMKFILENLIKQSDVDIKVEIDPKKFRPLDTPKIVCDNSKVMKHTGWKPIINIEKTLADVLEYWRNLIIKT